MNPVQARTLLLLVDWVEKLHHAKSMQGHVFALLSDHEQLRSRIDFEQHLCGLTPPQLEELKKGLGEILPKEGTL